MARKRYNLNLDPELVARVDVAAGDVSRSRWVERALEEKLFGDEEAALRAAELKADPVPAGYKPLLPSRASQGLGKGYFPARPKKP